ncbi:TPA: CRISPR-associated endonuclease Cas1 [Klebsiella oxytoca]|nr:CRISPR-associated endonuclease Cas1 [Klebsiella oxytoca]
MLIHWIRSGRLDAIGGGLIHIVSEAIRPIITRPGDIVIAERSGIGGLAIEFAYRCNVSIFITGPGGTKVYSWLPVNRPWEQIARQAVACNSPRVINAVARWMLEKRFCQVLHPAHGVNVVRGREGAEVRRIYKKLSAEFGINWEGRQTTGKWNQLTPLNKTISLCNAALYGLTEIAVIYSGYSPHFGFLHGRSGKALVYDIADIVKFEYITPIAFRAVADGRPNPEWRARAACIRLFRRSTLLRELISLTEETMDVAIKSLTETPSRRGRKNLP